MDHKRGKSYSNQKYRRTGYRRRSRTLAKAKAAAIIKLLLILIVMTAVAIMVFGEKQADEENIDIDGLSTNEAVATIALNDYSDDCFFAIDGRMYYEDDQYTSATGIDVSSYQKEINWENVKADGIDFAMIKVGYRGYSEGEIKDDSRFEENIDGALEAGLDVGVYFFSQATTVQEAVEEAEYVLEKVGDRELAYPIAFDMEYVAGGDRINNLTCEEKTAIANAFCQYIVSKGYRAMIYASTDWLYDEYNIMSLTDYAVWMAHYTEKPQYPYEYSIWQYEDSGTVDGISGSVDLNIAILPKY